MIKRLYIALLASLLCAAGAQALPTDYYAPASDMASGRWVKVRVAADGVVQVSYDRLREWGFDNPQQVSVRGFSAGALADHAFSELLPDGLPVVPTVHRDDRLMFYAETDTRYRYTGASTVVKTKNLSEAAGYYFITDAPSPTPVVIGLDAGATTPVTTHRAFYYFDPCDEYATSFGALKYSAPLTSQGWRAAFTLDGLAQGTDSDAVITYDFVGTTRSNAQLRMTLEGSYNTLRHTASTLRNNSLANVHNRYNIARGGKASFRVGEGGGSFEVCFLPPTNTQCTYSAIDNVTVTYLRDNVIDEAHPWRRMDFYEMGGLVGVRGDRPLVAVNISLPQARMHATGYEAESGTTTFTVASAEPAVVVFDPAFDGYPTPEFAGVVEYQNLHGIDVPEMVIIATPPLLEQARRLADLHRRHQSMAVEIVTPGMLYDEFTSGARSVDAYRRFLKMLADKAPGRLKYVMLFGPAPDDITKVANPDDYVMSYQADLVEYHLSDPTAWLSDAFFGMLADSFNADLPQHTLMAVSVGRLAVADANAAAHYVDKVEAYLSEPPLDATRLNAVLLCSHGDNRSHLRQAERLASTMLDANPAVTLNKIYNNIYFWTENNPSNVRQALKLALERGQSYFSFTGHAGAGAIANIMSIAALGDYDFAAPMFGTLSTCQTFSFDVAPVNIVTEMLGRHDGTLALVASAREVYQDYNQYLSEAMGARYFDARPGDCIGDVYMRAHNESPGTGNSAEGVMVNNMSYNLAGDPALPLYVAEYEVLLTDVNGTEVGETTVVSPAAALTLEGEIVDGDGSVASDFDGTMDVTVYETPSDIKAFSGESYGTDGTSNDVTVTRDEVILGRLKCAVKNGRWRAETTLPVPTRAGGPNRIQLYARREGTTVTAVGVDTTSIEVAAMPAGAVEDVTPPVISAMNLNGADFVEGDIVEPEGNVLIARIEADASGIDFSSRSIGGAMTLCLDDQTTYPTARAALRPAVDGSAELTYRLPAMTEGLHELTLTVADNAGNRATRSLTFAVSRDRTLTLVTDKETVRDEVTIDIEEGVAADELTLIVEDNEGNHAYTRRGVTLPLTWNFSDDLGRTLPDGMYDIFLTGRDGSTRFSTQRRRLLYMSR